MIKWLLKAISNYFRQIFIGTTNIQMFSAQICCSYFTGYIVLIKDCEIMNNP